MKWEHKTTPHDVKTTYSGTALNTQVTNAIFFVVLADVINGASPAYIQCDTTHDIVFSDAPES